MKAKPKRTRPRSTASVKTTKVFRDPIHDLIYLGPEDQIFLSLIDTKEFQRLRRIKQLGLVNFVYPGAEHTRFSHSLGVFNFARRMIEKLSSRHGGAVATELKNHAPVIKAAALLHDLGHGPFSHVFQRVFMGGAKPAPKHEEWTCRILLDESTDVNERLRAAKIKPKEVVALVSDERHGNAAGILPPAAPYLKDIVSSQLDADRMDYLLRDGLLTGCRYGRYDSEWILNALVLGNVSWAQKKLKKLCLDASKGTGAIVGLLFARLLMTEYVYGHKTARAYESELVCTLRLAAELAEKLPKDTPEPVRTALETRGAVDPKTYLMLDDEVVWWALRRWAVWNSSLPGRAGDMAASLARHALRLVRRRQPWRTHVLEQQDQFLLAGALIKHLHDQKDPLRFECYLDSVEDLPYKDLRVLARRGSDDEQAYFRDIFLVKNGARARPILELAPTPVLKALNTELQLFRFHYDVQYAEEFAGLLKEYGVC